MFALWECEVQNGNECNKRRLLQAVQQLVLLIAWFALIFIVFLQGFEEARGEGYTLNFFFTLSLFLFPKLFVLRYEKQNGIVGRVKNMKNLCPNWFTGCV